MQRLHQPPWLEVEQAALGLRQRLELTLSRPFSGHSRGFRLDFLMTGSQDKKYVNVVGGPEDCRAIGTTVLEMKRAGFTEAGRISVVPGPLLVATTDIGRALTHMPLDPGSTYPLITDSLSRAYELANPEGSPDPQLDLGSRSMPRWAHHSNRRGSNSVARKTQALTGATEMEIDLTYGWQERYYNKKMQVHYEARFDRVRRAAVSSLL